MMLNPYLAQPIEKRSHVWQRWLDICDMYLSLRHLSKLKFLYDSICIYVSSNFNNAYNKWDNCR